MTDPRTFLFLQGLPGPFFARLGRALRDAGARVRRVNFNLGDAADWGQPGAAAYRGGATGWGDWLGRHLERHAITDVVLFGDTRPLHRAAHALCEARGLPVHVFEEGYLRPDFVTLEQGGVNGWSPLPRTMAELMRAALCSPPVGRVEGVGGMPGRRQRETFAHYTAVYLGWALYPGYRSHRPVSPLLEGGGWVRRFAGRGREARRTADVLAGLGDDPYFLLPLQLDSDTQLRIHSRFGAMRPALEAAIASFGRGARAGVRLLVKRHPLDPGLTDWRGVVAALAQRHAVAGRVAYIDGGDIGDLVARARGLVTVNSTTGTLALAAGVPVKVLGTAVYDIAGITNGAPLDAFWHAPGVVDARAFQALRRVLIARSLVNGGFHDARGLELLVRGSVARLLGREQVGARARVAA